MKDPAEVLDNLEAVLDELEDAGGRGAILVEGRRDAVALAHLGIGGRIELLNRGVPLLKLCEDLAGLHASIVILVDWDAKGDELAERLAAGLRRGQVEVDLELRKRLRRLTRGAVQSVEELAAFHRRVRAAAQSKGPDRSLPVSWREKKAESERLTELRKLRGEPRGPRP